MEWLRSWYLKIKLKAISKLHRKEAVFLRCNIINPPHLLNSKLNILKAAWSLIRLKLSWSFQTFRYARAMLIGRRFLRLLVKQPYPIRKRRSCQILITGWDSYIKSYWWHPWQLLRWHRKWVFWSRRKPWSLVARWQIENTLNKDPYG